MKYLIFNNDLDATERNHARKLQVAVERGNTVDSFQTMRDCPYWWSKRVHPTTGEAALAIPDAEAVEPILSADDVKNLEDSLDATWEVQDV